MNEDTGMSGEDVVIAFAALDIEDPHKAARIFNVHVRTIWAWRKDGAPLHATLAIEELLAGRVRPRGVRYLLERIGRSRNDCARYRPKRTSSSGTSSSNTASA